MKREILKGFVIDSYPVLEHPSGHQPAVDLDPERCAMCNRRLPIFAPYGICVRCDDELNRMETARV